MKEGEFECSVLFADNDKIRGVYNVQDGSKSSRRKFVQCFPACNHEHSCEKFCGMPISVVLTINLKDSRNTSYFSFDDIVFVAELRQINANYALQMPLSRSQLSKQMKQSGFLYAGNLITSLRGKQHNGDKSVQNGYYDFVLNGLNLPEPRRKETVSVDGLYTFSVTVLMPLDKEETESKARTEKNKENILHPVAHFDSAPFYIQDSSAFSDQAVEKHSQMTNQPSNLFRTELQEAQSLLGLYHTIQTERMALERRDLHVKLTAFSHSKKNPPKLLQPPLPTSTSSTSSFGAISQRHSYPQNHQQGQQQNQPLNRTKRPLAPSMLMPPSKQTRSCVPVDLVTEDMMEFLQESTALAQRPYLWQSVKGKSVRDPTVSLMRGLVQQSALERALHCITKHNSILHGDIVLEDEVEGMTVEEAAAAVGNTAATTEDVKEKEQEQDGEKGKESIGMAGQASSKTAPTVKTIVAGSAYAASRVPVSVSVPVSSASSEEASSKKDPQTPVASMPSVEPLASEPKESDSLSLSLEQLKKHLQSQYRDPHASLLQRQCYSDMLQSFTKDTWQVAVRVRRAAERTAPPLPARPSTAFDLYCMLMRDAKREHLNLTKAFLASEPPPLKALNWAVRYLRGKGELHFRTSRVSAQTVAAAAAITAAANAAAASAAAPVSSAPLIAAPVQLQQNQQQQQVALVQSDTSQQLPDKSALESAFAQSLQQQQQEEEAQKGSSGQEKGNGEEGRVEGGPLSLIGDALEREAVKTGPLPLPLPGVEGSTVAVVAVAPLSATASQGNSANGSIDNTVCVKAEKVCDNEDSFSSELDAEPSCSVSVPISAPSTDGTAVAAAVSAAAVSPLVSVVPKAPLRGPAEILAQFKALVADSYSSHSSDESTVGMHEAAPALALVAMVSDYVCSGGCEQRQSQEQRAADTRRHLQAHLETTYTAQCALLQESFLWDSSSVSLENVGRSSEFFATYRPAPLMPYAHSHGNNTHNTTNGSSSSSGADRQPINQFQPRPQRPPSTSTKKAVVTEASLAAAAAAHEAVRNGAGTKRKQRADPDGRPTKSARKTDAEGVRRTKRSANNDTEKASPSRPKRIATKAAKQAAARSSRTGATNSTNPSSKKGKKKKGKTVKKVLAETRPLHRLTSMLAVGGSNSYSNKNYKDYNEEQGSGSEAEEEGESVEGEDDENVLDDNNDDGNSLQSGTDESNSSDSASLMSLASQEEDGDELEDGPEEGQHEYEEQNGKALGGDMEGSMNSLEAAE